MYNLHIHLYQTFWESLLVLKCSTINEYLFNYPKTVMFANFWISG